VGETDANIFNDTRVNIYTSRMRVVVDTVYAIVGDTAPYRNSDKASDRHSDILNDIVSDTDTLT